MNDYYVNVKIWVKAPSPEEAEVQVQDQLNVLVGKAGIAGYELEPEDND